MKIPHRAVRTGATAFVLLSGLVAGVSVPSAARAATEPVSSGDIIHSAPGHRLPRNAPANGDVIDTLGHWTPERMRSAIPIEDSLVERGASTRSHTTTTKSANGRSPIVVNPVEPTESATSNEPPQAMSSVGKLFFDGPDGNSYVCSGAVVTSRSGNLVHTAGHCVYEAKKGWMKNFFFVPSYTDGTGPHGGWNGDIASTFTAWADDEDYSHDQAFISFYPHTEGISMQQYFGGNGLMFNGGTSRTGVTIYGYPAADPYHGNIQYYCSGETSWVWFTSDTRMGCPMTGGSSGGPWYASLTDDHVGMIYAVTSRGGKNIFGTPYLITTPDGNDVYDLYNSANT
ncbi:secreted protein [Leifsonia xyli subsp. xyli str. CTCB07]|uniref:Secreted protein n=2 Tax=Leifsonia xyli subsp. xyli TaxID=59736 RepID=Q6AG07_LEIXX|nr:secreted protein [Leifsonia xyli]AAT88688.1 secreted protein [Leifsonia xyli subsp. xyli str. CTCB07]